MLLLRMGEENPQINNLIMPLMVSGVFPIPTLSTDILRPRDGAAVGLLCLYLLDTSSTRQAVDIFSLGQGPIHENSVGRILLQSKMFSLQSLNLTSF